MTKILIVDDREENLLSMSLVLKPLNVNIDTANSGKEALDKASDNEYALIILDVMMPEMDGYETARIIKNSTINKDTPIIFVTAMDVSEYHAIRGYKEGAIDFMFKPINEDILISKVNLFLQLYEMRKKLEDRVKERTKEIISLSKYFQRIVDLMPSGIISTNSIGIVNYTNKMCRYIIGNIEKGRILWDQVPELVKYSEYYKKDMPIKLYKERIFDNKEKYFNIFIFRLEDNEIIWRIDDVTDIKMKEDQLIQSQKMEIVGTLAGGFAHDFNNAVSGIIGAISVLKYEMNNGTLTDDALRKYLNTIEEAANRSSDMVKQILSLSRKQDMEIKPIDLNDMIVNIKKICDVSFGKKVKTEINLFEGKPIVKGDYSRLSQSILNICINGYHAMTIMRKDGDEGGVLTIGIEKVNLKDVLTDYHYAANNKMYYKIYVKDEGVGIPRDILPKIFDPFFTTKSEKEGTGLGLSMVYNTIESHNGFISVNSEEGKGTVFNICLPVCEESYKYGEYTDSNNKYKNSILVVDEEMMCFIAKSLLENYGYNVMTACSGDKAIDIYRKKHREIDIIILDIMLSGKNGKNMLYEFRNINKNAKIIISSDFRINGDIADIMNDNTYFLQKPYDNTKLINAINKISKEV